MTEGNKTKKATSVLPNFELAELQDFYPKAFLEAENKELAKLMLTFSLAYNDFKDYMWFRELFVDAREKVDTTKITNTLGQLNGMNEHCTRMLIAHLRELLDTIREHQKLYDGKEFKKMLYYLEKIIKGSNKDWWKLVALANGEATGEKFYKKLIEIRNTGTYHYKDTKCMFIGLEYYMKKESETGFVSLGPTLEQTRFYFADAAIQHYHRKTINEYGNKFWDKLTAYTKDVNILLRFIVEIYITQILGVKFG